MLTRFAQKPCVAESTAQQSSPVSPSVACHVVVRSGRAHAGDVANSVSAVGWSDGSDKCGGIPNGPVETSSLIRTLVALSSLIDWRRLLTVVKPDTLVRWHRKGFQLLWRWRSTPRGRPRLPVDVQELIAEIAAANHTWGEEPNASELLLKLGICVSPRTVRR
jgi:hypothetical protein